MGKRGGARSLARSRSARRDAVSLAEFAVASSLWTPACPAKLSLATTPAAAAPQHSSCEETRVISIGVLIFDDVEELDFVGPWEVFTSAREAGKELQVVTIAQSTAEAIRCAKGMRVLPDHSFDDAPGLDIVLVPGGQGTRREIDNPVLIEWLRKVGESCTWVTSVCTGSLLLSAGRRSWPL